MRPRNSAQKVQNREGYRHRDSVQHIEDQHRDGRAQRQERLAAPKAGDPAQLGKVDQPERGEDDEGAEGGEGERGECRTEEQEGEQQHRRRDEECSWVRLPIASPIAVRLPLLLTGNPENSRAPRLAAPRAKNSCRASIASRRRREGPTGDDVVGVGDDGDAEGGRHQSAEVD